MEEILLIRSSSHPDDPYKLHFGESDDGCMKLRCYCPAGVEQMLCKHVIGLLTGDRDLIFDAQQSSLFDDALALAERTGAAKHCREMEPKIKALKRQFEAARRELKDELCTRLREGRRFEV